MRLTRAGPAGSVTPGPIAQHTGRSPEAVGRSGRAFSALPAGRRRSQRCGGAGEAPAIPAVWPLPARRRRSQRGGGVTRAGSAARSRWPDRSGARHPRRPARPGPLSTCQVTIPAGCTRVTVLSIRPQAACMCSTGLPLSSGKRGAHGRHLMHAGQFLHHRVDRQLKPSSGPTTRRLRRRHRPPSPPSAADALLGRERQRAGIGSPCSRRRTKTRPRLPIAVP